jgi:hypothetical protein
VVARLFLLSVATLSFAQTAAEEDFHVYTDSPRILLTKQRLRLLQREKSRQSMRWQQFDTLITGGAALPEPGFAWAMYYQVAQDQAVGKKAVQWALSAQAGDLRQLALVFDWCGPLMNKEQADQLAGKLEKALAGNTPDDPRLQSDRVLAAIALADRLPDHGEAILRNVVQQWWRGVVAKRIERGEPAVARDQLYWVYEMLHAIRDNLKIDLREVNGRYFKTLPVDHISGHYPAPLEAPENEYRVPIYTREGEPDLKDAAMSRATEFAMVAYDDNALESQYLQGWLMQDRFVMKSGLGAVYEFLWANPYQPGLSYFHVQPVFHDADTGHIFARTSWDEDATWIGYFDGHLQMFTGGQVQSLRPGAAVKPLHIGDALFLSAESKDAFQFRANAEAVFVLNLASRSHYDVELDDEELWDLETDSGGTLVLSLPEGSDRGARIRRHDTMIK